MWYHSPEEAARGLDLREWPNEALARLIASKAFSANPTLGECDPRQAFAKGIERALDPSVAEEDGLLPDCVFQALIGEVQRRIVTPAESGEIHG